MKRILSAALVLAMMISSASALNLYFDSKPMQTDVPAQIINSRTMVPIGHIFNAFGAKVTWDNATKTAIGEKDGTTITLQIGNKNAYINDQLIELDVPPMIVDSRTMVPAAFVSTALGAKVYWDGETSTVRIAQQVYEVVRVVDGDTIVVNFNGKEEKVRLIGVDTPESVHPDASKNEEAGIAASDYTKEKLLGKSVELEFDVQERDKYGRLLAYVWVDGVMYNKTLLREGIADLATYPPNVAHVDEFKAIVDARNPAPTPTPDTPHSNGGSGSSLEDLASANYIGNSNTKKFHIPSCSSVDKIRPEHKVAIENRDEAIQAGYEPCRRCHP